MQFAIDNNQNRIHIDDAIVGEDYYCPCCGNVMIQRRGEKNIPHFAHARGSECSDSWRYEEMSEWHKKWQAKYPVECREVMLEKADAKHRADVCISGTVIEFQHSTISAREFRERNEFYTSTGHKLIWLFDGTTGREKTTENVNVYVYVQTDDGIVDSSRREKYTEEEFIALSSTGKLGTPMLYHTLYMVERSNGDLEYFGCPINDDGYAPVVREYHRITCDECRYCLEIGDNTVKCRGRYRNYEIRTVLEYDDYRLKYIDHAGKLNTVDIPPIGQTLFQLAMDSQAQLMVVRNTKSGNVFKITKNPVDQLCKYGKVYGSKRNAKGYFYRSGKELWYCNKPDWILLHYE